MVIVSLKGWNYLLYCVGNRCGLRSSVLSCGVDTFHVPHIVISIKSRLWESQSISSLLFRDIQASSGVIYTGKYHFDIVFRYRLVLPVLPIKWPPEATSFIDSMPRQLVTKGIIFRFSHLYHMFPTRLLKNRWATIYAPRLSWCKHFRQG
jgi:hypothetical protein